MPERQLGPSRPRDPSGERESDAAAVQCLRRRSPGHPVLLYVRALRRLQGQPGGPELATSERATVSANRTGPTGVGGNRGELLAAVCLVAVSHLICPDGRRGAPAWSR